jgi:hypothetical protein
MAGATASHHAHPGHGVLGMPTNEGRDSLFGQSIWETSSKSMRNKKNNQRIYFFIFPGEISIIPLFHVLSHKLINKSPPVCSITLWGNRPGHEDRKQYTTP